MLNAARQKLKDNEARIRLLQDRWPNCFALYGRRRKPLKIGIAADLLATGILPADELKAALGYYTRAEGYLQAIRAGAARVDLDGTPAGEVTAEHEALAQVQIKARQARKAVQKAAKQVAAATHAAVRRRPILSLKRTTEPGR